MQFLKTLRDSIYGPKFYASLSERPFLFSMKYFIKFALFAGLVGLIAFAVRTPLSSIPTPQKIRGFIDQGGTLYPQELVVTIKNGQASVNVSEPYMIPMSESFQSKETSNRSGASADQMQPIKNFLVIDTARPFSTETFRDYRTAILLTRDSFIIGGGGTQMRIFPLEKAGSAEITKKSILLLSEKIKPYAVWVIPFFALILIFVFLLVNGFYLAYLLFGAFLIWGLTALLKKRMSYKHAYQIGLHAITGSIIFDGLMKSAPFHLRLPFVFTLLMLLAVVVNFSARIKSASAE